MNLFKNKTAFTLLSVLLILSGLWLLTSASGNGLFKSVVNTVSYPFRMLSIGASNSEELKTNEELKAENDQLKSEISKLTSKLVDYYDIKRENAQLRKYYNIKSENNDFELMPALVIGRDASENFYSFTANKGTSSGVDVNDPVLTENGLVGYVSHVDFTSCTVTTVLSPNIKVSAVDSKTNDTGVISGSASLCKDNKTALRLISSDHTIKEGDIISTSGMGGIYPPGIVIGRVESLEYDEFDVSQYAIIKPYDNIQEISDIVIVTDYAK